MKKLSFIVTSIIFLTSFHLKAQDYLYDVFAGDTTILNCPTATGSSFQWQQSTDNVNWIDISGAVSKKVTITVAASSNNSRYYRLKVTDTVCVLKPVNYSSVLRYRIITSVSQVITGEWFRGGYVLTANSGIGLITRVFQGNTYEWGCVNYSGSAITSFSNDGPSNTTAILQNCSQRPIAASICDTLSFGGLTDWYLPSLQELNSLYQQRNNLIPAVYGFYWSSNDYDGIDAWTRLLTNNTQQKLTKNNPLSVGCYRRLENASSHTYTYSEASFTPLMPAVVTAISPAQELCTGDWGILTITPGGTTPFTYQWKKNHKDISNETSNTLNISSLVLGDEDYYTCEVSNICRSIESDSIRLTVNGISPDKIRPADVTVKWNRRTARKYALFMKQTSSGNPIPVNGITYNASANFGQGSQIGTSGWYCVFYDTGNAATVKNLLPLTAYRIAMYEDTSSTASPKYLNICNPINVTTTNYTAPFIQSQEIIFSNVTHNSFSMKWTPGDGSYRVVFVKAGNSGLASPVDNTTYTADTVFMSGSQLGISGWYCVYNGSGSSVNVSGLMPNTDYRAMVLDFNGVSGSEKYLNWASNNNPADRVTRFEIPSSQSYSISFTNLTATSFRANWIRGNGVSCAVFVKEDDTTYAQPQQDVSYTAGSLFKSGMQIGGTGWYCVYNGTGTYVNVTGLLLGKTYRVMVCEYNGISGKETYNTNPATNNPANQTVNDPVPTIQASGIMLSNIYPSSFRISWTSGNGANRAVFIIQANNGMPLPVNNITYTADTVFSNGSQIGTSGWFCVYNGSGSEANVTGLQYNVTYRVMVCEYNGTAGKEQYNTSNGASNPVNATTQMETPLLCIVTVDTLTWKNKVMWGRPMPKYPVSGFNIYKEVSTNLYSLIGTVPYDNPPVFVDMASVPESHGDKYKIAFVDQFSLESGRSKYHKTMNLTISKNGSTMGLRWDAYEDESGTFIPSKYYIYRGTQPDNMQLLDSVTGSFTSYNDNNVFSVYYYLVGVVKDDGCADYNRGSNTVTSFSNKKDNKSLVGINERGSSGNVSVYPNPFTESTTISFPNDSKQPYLLRIYDVSGKMVREVMNITDNKVEVIRAGLSVGIYSFDLVGKEVYRGRFLVE